MLSKAGKVPAACKAPLTSWRAGFDGSQGLRCWGASVADELEITTANGSPATMAVRPSTSMLSGLGEPDAELREICSLAFLGEVAG